MKRELLHKLATEHKGCFHIHIEQKEIMSDADGLALLNADFQDVSYSDDMAPSFYHVRDWGNLDVPCIFGVQERDDDENFISSKITWWVNDVANPNNDQYETVQEAIDSFFKLFPLSK
tara:strand:+ start:293 stop:646 length:354 start_codon:yes stop_codon:yes gene_type:complete